MIHWPTALPPEVIPVEIGVYVHIPFCTSRCHYCGFHSNAKLNEEEIARTLRTMVAEARNLMNLLEQPRVATVYIGGGTPSAVPARLLGPFLAELAAVLGLPEHGFAGSPADAEVAEWTVEANPETFGPDFLAAVGDAGANRISLGVQSFDDHALRTLGRRASRERVDRALDLLAGSWRGRRSIDLIAGIPGHGPDAAARDAELAVATGIEHVSLYQLTPEPGTRLAGMPAAGRLKLDPGLQEEAWLAAAERLLAAGLADYEVSNYARANAASRHNQRYWRMEPYIGVGPGAVGTLRTNDWQPDLAAVRLTRSFTATRPVSGTGRLTQAGSPASSPAGQDLSPHPDSPCCFRGFPPEYSVELLDSDTLALELCMVGLRTAEGVDPAELTRLTGSDSTESFLKHIQGWAGFRYVDRQQLHTKGRLALTRAGRRILDHLLVSLELPGYFHRTRAN